MQQLGAALRYQGRLSARAREIAFLTVAAAYQSAVAALGADQLFELTTLVGYYGLLALQLRVFAVN